jgi:hypothetical protein
MEHGVRLSERWQHGLQLDVMSEMKRLMLAITSQMTFGTKTDVEADEIKEAVGLVISQFQLFGSHRKYFPKSVSIYEAKLPYAS